MVHATVAAVGEIAAGTFVGVEDGPSLNTSGVVEWGVRNIIPILLLIIGISIIASARKGRLSDNANTLTNVMLGCGVIAGAAILYGFAGSLTRLIFGA